MFDTLKIHPDTIRALKETFGYERLSKPQVVYMPLMLREDKPDVFVKAGTGSGKTLGFLIPVIEALIQHGRPGKVGALILSPVKDLARQTSVEATKLLTFHTGLRAGVVVGGEEMRRDLQMLKDPPAILVATPGRLLDLLSNPEVARNFAVQTVILDEADRLLDPGFAPDVKKILRTMPGVDNRRTLLFTATVTDEIGFVPADTYQQRVGRTGRAGAAGQAVILLGRDEAKGLDKLKAVAPALEVVQAQPVLEAERKALALPPAQQKEAEAAFRGLLGSNKSHAKALGLAPQGIVDAVAARLLGMGMAKVPHISDATLKKMGLTGVSFDTDAIKAREIEIDLTWTHDNTRPTERGDVDHVAGEELQVL
ncbi:DEAD-box ATP-dependent RNA helicase 26 [Tetrabaena socialis]|uniref:DEAD-box ATP-dependent RNA helicase 26 n=1 Tax=Tetrabaena socialis TaxID=47790 RepID=A0A2J7ZL02_9CHLO|nr:DEAD-box ATP-dependent RNA helicase 26 [Tetrabaena socialis]|eukprot:PNH00946.1 DEAD-box ATP-dependent RNA helicase 26 [Tetrabaena socialis]